MANKPLKTIKFPGLADTYTIPQVDNTLATSGAAADAKKTGDEITSIKEDISEIVPGLSDAAKTALLACFEHVAWIDDDGQDYYDALAEALDIEPVKPIITLAEWIYPTSSPTNKGFTQYGNAPSDNGSGLYYNVSGGYTYSVPIDEATEKVIVETTVTPTTSYTPPASSAYDGIRFTFARGNIAVNSLGIVYVETLNASSYTVVGTATTNTTYRLKAEVDMNNGIADIYVDDVLVKQGAHIDLSIVTDSVNVRITSTTGTAKYTLKSLSCKVQ